MKTRQNFMKKSNYIFLNSIEFNLLTELIGKSEVINQ